MSAVFAIIFIILYLTLAYLIIYIPEDEEANDSNKNKLHYIISAITAGYFYLFHFRPTFVIAVIIVIILIGLNIIIIKSSEKKIITILMLCILCSMGFLTYELIYYTWLM